MKKFRVLLALLLLSIIIMSINVNSAFVVKDSNNLVSAYKNNNLLRLHVLANSNSPKDQYLKRFVRNKVLQYISDSVERKNFNINKEIVNLDKYIEGILLEENVSYKAETELGTYFFPSRTYDDLTLPAGRYKALKIILGKGKGTNWWCVLLPPMCIENKETENIERENIEFRFKIVEWFKEKFNNNQLVDYIDSNEKIEKNTIVDKTLNDGSFINEEKFKSQVYLNNNKEIRLIDKNIIKLKYD